MTPYADIFNRFRRFITDFDLDEVAPENKQEILVDMLNNVCDSWYPLPTGIDLSRDNSYTRFNVELDSTTKSIIAYGMVRDWLSPYLYNQDLMESTLSTKEYTSYSDANRINAMRLLFGEANKEMKNLATKLSVGRIVGRLK